MPAVYQLLEDRYLGVPIEDLPDDDRLIAALDAVWGCEEFVVKPVCSALVGSGGEITYAELGRMLSWVENLRIAAAVLTDECGEIVSALHEFTIKEQVDELRNG